MKNGLKEKEEMHVFTLLSFYKAKDTFSEMYLENSTHALGVFQFRKNAKWIWSCYSLPEHSILK